MARQIDRSAPAVLPVVPVRGIVLLPHSVMPLTIGRRRSLRAAREVGESRRIAVFSQRDSATEDPGPEELHEIGCAGIVLKAARIAQEQGTTLAFVEGGQRVRRRRVVRVEPFLELEVEFLEDELPESPEEDAEFAALERNVRDLFQEIVKQSSNLSDDLVSVASSLEGASAVADFAAANIPAITPELRQQLLEELQVKRRMRRLVEELLRERESLRLRNKIRSEVSEKIAETQREAILREQLKAIQRELGQGEEVSDIEVLRRRVEEAQLPEEARAVADRELGRLAQIPPASPEYTVALTYLEWLASMPWASPELRSIDIDQAERILDEDHYDLVRVKERILEHLAVFNLKHDLKGPILCFVGPPGVGKTSLGRSIARSMDRPFVRISLGGMRDEAEIRGHRRTYIGALPGQIIQGMRRAGRADPVFMLDEVDKLGRDFRGDPASALLEVLDPAQNSTFRDHYLEVPFDLSKVLFITTANILDTIPPPLLDRMEVLELPGYTQEEKVEIARAYLVPKQLDAHGLGGEHIRFTTEALEEIIRSYTHEAGVRELERQIAAVCRKRARQIMGDGGMQALEVTAEVVREMLGAPRYHVEMEVEERTRIPGVAVGLAWTPVGGEILFVESSRIPRGKGVFTITGQVRSVMEESAKAALSWLRAHAEHYGIDPRSFQEHDIHVHIPAGAVPKDGPSAGVAMVTSLTSLFTGRPIRPWVAMTGEITLTGIVLRVGGIKEKVLAARRSGIAEVILPAENEAELVEEVPEHLRRELTFHFVHRVEEALEIVLDHREEAGRPWPLEGPETRPPL